MKLTNEKGEQIGTVTDIREDSEGINVKGVVLDAEGIAAEKAKAAREALDRAEAAFREANPPKHFDRRGREEVSLKGVRALKPSKRTARQRKALRAAEKAARRASRAPKKVTR